MKHGSHNPVTKVNARRVSIPALNAVQVESIKRRRGGSHGAAVRFAVIIVAQLIEQGVFDDIYDQYCDSEE